MGHDEAISTSWGGGGGGALWGTWPDVETFISKWAKILDTTLGTAEERTKAQLRNTHTRVHAFIHCPHARTV